MNREAFRKRSSVHKALAVAPFGTDDADSVTVSTLKSESTLPLTDESKPHGSDTSH